MFDRVVGREVFSHYTNQNEWYLLPVWTSRRISKVVSCFSFFSWDLRQWVYGYLQRTEVDLSVGVSVFQRFWSVIGLWYMRGFIKHYKYPAFAFCAGKCFVRFSWEHGNTDYNETLCSVLYVRQGVIEYFELLYLLW